MKSGTVGRPHKFTIEGMPDDFQLASKEEIDTCLNCKRSAKNCDRVSPSCPNYSRLYFKEWRYKKRDKEIKNATK